MVFETWHDKVTEQFPQIDKVVMDSAYRTPRICKRIFADGKLASLPYKSPMTKDGWNPYCIANTEADG